METYVKPRAASNPGHLEYFFCYDANDPDAVVVFQLYRDQRAMDEFLADAWYPEYLNAVSEVVANPPDILPALLVWQKPKTTSERELSSHEEKRRGLLRTIVGIPLTSHEVLGVLRR